MMLKVPKADVVIVNPTHYAVALQYDEQKMRAPRVVAKGVDLIAARIREIADAHGVTIVEAPPLARALHRHVEIDAEIPAALYVAVAQVLSYVFQLRAARRVGMPPPPPPILDPATIPPERTAGELRAGV
jgi:flagellar biosynthetic protein FlhB